MEDVKKVLLAQARVGEDKDTKERLLWTMFVDLPNKGRNGQVWYPLKNETLMSFCFGEDRHPEQFALLRKAVPGTLLALEMGFNVRTNKPMVKSVSVLKEGYTEEDIYDIE